jgi:outer membrane biosynthesis protein TonB
MGVTPHNTQPTSIVVTLPAHSDKPFRVTFPEKPISASSSIAMASELSLIVTPTPGTGPKPARLQTGPLIYYVWPRYSAKGNRYGTSQTIKVRVTVSPLGQVQSIKFVDGSSALLHATTSALQAWRYKPTLLNNTPVQVQQLVTIEFRPTQYLTQARRPHPLQQK